MANSKKKIVVIGGFGWEDMGDEAMPQAVLYNLRKTIPNLDIVMLSPNPTYTTTYHKECAIYDLNTYLNEKPWLFSKLTSRKLGIIGTIINKIFTEKFIYFSKWLYFLIAIGLYNYKIHLPLNKKAGEILNELVEADLLFNNGGGNINSLLSEELYKQTLTILAGSILKVPVILSGQTIGPIEKKMHAFVVKMALNKVDMLTFRDRGISQQRVKDIGVTRPIMQDTADDSMNLPYLKKEKVIEFILENGGENWNDLPADITVAMNINSFLKAMEKSKINEFSSEVSLLVKIADRLVEKYNARILLIPTDYGADDRPLLKQIKNKMRYYERALIIEKKYDAIQLKSLLCVADIAIGVRYHFNVFATSMGVPCIGMANGIYQKTKIRGLMLLYDLPECFIEEDMGLVKLETVWATVNSVIDARDKIIQQLQQMTPILQERSLITIQRALELLKR